jgi:hypothetical protein
MVELHRTPVEIKAEPLTTTQLDRWLAGRMPRRVLVVPFGGPIPSPKAPRGVDLDGEWFSPRTDLTGEYAALKASRVRLVDWHHDADPTGKMKGAILGRVILDEHAEDDGYWADFWANAGEKRLALVKRLEERGAALYGSSQAATKAVDADTGEITYWPLIRHTITTSPQNILAVVPPVKAVLGHPDLAEQPADALRALLAGLSDDLAPSQSSTLRGERDAKAGRVLSARNMQAILDALSAFDDAAERLREVIARQPEYGATDED